MNEPISKAYKPGSVDALQAGCRCAVIDNHHGAGIDLGGPLPFFWINGDCPIHGRVEQRGNENGN